MSSIKMRSTARRLAGELVIVFAGVPLALAADDFRESREERREARQSLGVMVTDLRSDSVEYVQAGRTMRQWAGAAIWLTENWKATAVDRDSAESTLSEFSRLTTLELSAAGFEGLRNSNRVRLIADESVRTGILQYYQTHPPRTVALHDAILEQRWALHDGLVPRSRTYWQPLVPTYRGGHGYA